MRARCVSRRIVAICWAMLRDSRFQSSMRTIPMSRPRSMWNQYFKPITTDDFDLRYFECQVAPQNPGGSQQLLKMTETGHLAGYFDIGRTEVDPMPADPDFKTTGIWWRVA